MKKALLLMAALLVSATAWGDLLAVGTQEAFVGAGFDRDKAVRFDAGYGYFLMYGFSMGPQASFIFKHSTETWMLGARAVKNINLGKPIIMPYLAAGLFYASTEKDGGGDSNDSAAVFRGDLGAKIPVAHNMTLGAALLLEAGTSKIFVRDGDLERTNLSFELGLTYAF